MDLNELTNKELIKRKSLLKKELFDIDVLLDIETNKKYEHMIGKYYQLSDACFIKINEIEYVDRSYVHVYGTKIYSEKCDDYEFRIERNGSESFSIDCKPTETTKEEFLEFMNKTVNFYVDNINKEINK